ncbi:MAG: hypothetical protein NZ898_03270 [Myxococcota bacterium]|nr:hypothetical protein [Myxococcota bacterium]
MPFEACRSGFDEDCDGLFDCDDPDCDDDPACRICRPRETVCTDGVDDDCDGLTDCVDPECARAPGCAPPCAPRETACSDGRDEDCDMLVDCRDPDCAVDPRCRPTADGGVPPRDGGTPRDSGVPPRDAGTPSDAGAMCTTMELGVAACTNMRDDDCDRRTDCADPDCSPWGPSGECCNGLDDDGDGWTDLFACRCRDNADCAGVGTTPLVCWTETYSVCAPPCNAYGGEAYCDMIDPAMRCVTSGPLAGQCVYP